MIDPSGTLQPRRNDLLLLSGFPGSGKSLVALDIAGTVAQTTQAVFVLTEAMPTHTTRLQAWSAHTHRDTDRLFWWDHPINLLDPAHVAYFIAGIAHLSPALIVIDNLWRCMVGGDENSILVLRDVLRQLQRIRDATGAAVLVTHISDRSGHASRGHTALQQAASRTITLTRQDDVITFRCEEPRTKRLLVVRQFRIVVEPTMSGPVLIPIDTREQGGAP